MFKRIDHIELLTAAPERAIAFYSGVLGFREGEQARIPETPSGPLDLVYRRHHPRGDVLSASERNPGSQRRDPSRLAMPRAGGD